MRLVIDANILFSAFIKEGLVRRLILFNIFELYAPKFVIEEFFEHIGELVEKTKVKKEILRYKIKDFISSSGIRLYSKKDILDFIEKSEAISPDKDDIMYFAAALKLNCPIWSNDRRLKEQAIVKVYSTSEILVFIMENKD